jgi:radical SAM superfamily enzyme YgiQ (UPF0313 family)
MNKIYETYSFSGQSINCYGLEVVKNIIKRNDFEFLPFDRSTDNPVLFSLYWPEQIYDFIKWRYQPGMQKKKIIVGGNTATANPAPIVACDNTMIYFGDGERWDGSIDSPYIVSKDTMKPAEKAVADVILPYYYEDIQQNRRAFCEISRGCKNYCLFCQYGWLKKYNECSVVDIEQIIKRSKTKSIRMFAADRFQHSQYQKIREMLKKAGKNDTGSDVSFRFVYKNPKYLQYTNKVRVGVEGMSERLRYLIGKKYSDIQVIEFCKMVAAAGIKSLDWYMIYGLPTENGDDVKQFLELLKRIDSEMSDGYTICIHWNAFTPSAQTPFEREKSSYGYDTTELNKILHGVEYNKRIKLYHKPKTTADSTLALRCIAIRANENCINLMNHIAANMARFKKNHEAYLKEFEKITGYSAVDKIDCVLPWERFVVYDKETMQKIKAVRLKKYGTV